MHRPIAPRPLIRPRLAIASLFAALSALLLAACGEEPPETVQLEPRTPQEVVQALRRDRAEVDAATDRILERLDRWNQDHPAERVAFSDLFPGELAGDQRNVLDELIASERDASYRGLLAEIVRHRDRIQELEQRIWSLEARLPGRHVTASRGDTHYELALAYLRDEVGLDEREARRQLASINLFEDLWPGHRVWLWYDDETDRFATWVTAGEAGSSPLAIQRAARRRLIEDRDAARRRAEALETQRDALADELVGLRAEKTRLDSEVRELERQRERVAGELAQAEAERDRLANAVFYHAASERDLERRGLVRDTLFTFPQLEEPEAVDYDRSQDLREATTLRFDPADYGLLRIRKVVLYPRYLEEGRDYRVHPAADGAVDVGLLEPEVFKGRKVVIALKS